MSDKLKQSKDSVSYLVLRDMALSGIGWKRTYIKDGVVKTEYIYSIDTAKSVMGEENERL